MHNKSLTEIANDLQTKQYSASELTEHFLKRIDRLDKQLNSFITVDAEQAKQTAKIADEQIANGNASPLTGIPIAQKDIFCTKGIKTTCASKMLDNFIAPYDATVVSKLKQAGTVLLGKTNMDEFAMGSSNENSHYGATRNPWDTTRIPGGSSGGSAAAVAARLCPIATGTDTGGSIRQPAAMCGISGLKPTYGRVSRYGMIAFASSLDQGGLFARDSADIALTLNAIAGYDEKDSTSINCPVPDYTKTLNNSIQGLKIGLPKQFFNQQLDTHIGDIIHTAASILKKRGCELIEVDLPNVHLSIPAYYIVAPAECSSNLARYDGVRYGYRCDKPIDLDDLYKRSRSEAFGDEVKRRIMIGTYVLSAGYFDAYYVKAQKIRRLIKNDFDTAYQQVDVILAPTTPTPAFKIGANMNDPIKMYQSDIYTIAVNLAGLPGMSIPAGLLDGFPVGMQLIGKHFDEARLLNMAHCFQQDTDWHLQSPQSFK